MTTEDEEKGICITYCSPPEDCFSCLNWQECEELEEVKMEE